MLEGGYPPSQQQQQLTFKRGGYPPSQHLASGSWGQVSSDWFPVAGAQSRPKSPKVARVFILMIYLMYWIYLMSFIYVIHLMCWNYLIDLITHSRNSNSKRAGGAGVAATADGLPGRGVP